MKQTNQFSFLRAGLLAPALLLLTMTPAALAQMHNNAPMNNPAANSNMNNNNGMAPDGMNGMQPTGSMAPGNPQQAAERRTFDNLRRNFDVETHLSKMALKHSQNADVKKFAQQVIRENHALSNDLVMPNMNGAMYDPDIVPSVTQKAEKQMKKMTGQPFDQQYLIQMDAYVKNDQQVARSAVTMTNALKLSQVGTRVQTMSDAREQQIASLTKESGFTIK